MSESRNHVLIPAADRLINSLRDVGYDFSTAVADIVDNSIDAGATEICIDIDFDDEEAWVRIIDNGVGMNEDEVLEAMRFGSEVATYQGNGLGKFGLGLKTASISQCRKLVLVSKSKEKGAKIHSYAWDLDHIKVTNEWEVLNVEDYELTKYLDGYLTDTSGTCVIWLNLDRVLAKRTSNFVDVGTIFRPLCRNLEEHLSMVFHRFLAGDVPDKVIKIILNGNQILPWDPFVRSENSLIKMESTKIKMTLPEHSGIITIQPYVLPPQNGFSSKDIFNRASGPKKWNRQQGFYIYRANRLIQSGGWCGIRTLDEHTKLARVSLDFPPDLDEVFKINISKMKVDLPANEINQIEEAIKPVLKKADEVYRKNTTNRNPITLPSQQTPINQFPAQTNPQVPPNIPDSLFQSSTIENVKLSFQEFKKILLDSATQIERVILEKIFQRVQKTKRIV